MRFRSLQQLALGATLLIIGTFCGGFTTLAQRLMSVSTAPTFKGDGDIVAGVSRAWSCSFAYTAAYAASGGNACLLVDASTGAVTYTMTFLSNGKANFAGAAASSACAVACVVKTMYDQTGNCDLTQTTLANMPPFTFSAIGGSIGAIVTNGSTDYYLSCANLAFGATQVQPWSSAFVASTSDISSTGTWWSTVTSGSDYRALLNIAYRIESGATLPSTATVDTNVHGFAIVMNSTSSINTVDTTVTTGDAGTRTMASAEELDLLHDSVGFSIMKGIFGGLTLWSNSSTGVALSSVQTQAVTANQKTNYGF